MEHIFERSGLAALSDLQSPEWKLLFAELEGLQAEFLAKERAFRSPEYKWPRDPLHNWSRLWEYPYVYHHLKAYRAQQPAAALPWVVDVGSGVTFLPFALARLGYQVTCADIDSICANDIPRAAQVFPHKPGRVDFRLIQEPSLPFADNEVDIVCCVSVLEHIPNPEVTVREMFRVLKPGGLLLLTIDLDLRGDSEIGVEPHRKLMAEISRCFEYYSADTTIHPADVLNNTNSLFRDPVGSAWARRWFLFKQVVKPWLGKPARPLLPFFLAIQGLVLSRRQAPLH